MGNKRIYSLDAGTFDSSAYVPIDKSGNTAAQKIALGSLTTTILFSHVNDSSNTDANENTLYTDPIPANTLNTNGQAMRCIYFGNNTTYNGNKAWKIYWNSTLLGTNTFSGATGGAIQLGANFIRISATEVRVIAELVRGGLSNTLQYTALTSQDLTIANTLAITVQITGGGVAAATANGGCCWVVR